MKKNRSCAAIVAGLLLLTASVSAETVTLGETGTSSNYFNTVNRIRAIVRTAEIDGNLDSIYVYVANVQNGAVAKGVVYDSTTLQLVDSTAEKTLSTDGGSFHWEGFAFLNAGAIDSGDTYLIGILIGPTYVGVSRDPTTDSRYYGDYTYADGVPSSLSGGVWATDQVHSIYVVYTVSTQEPSGFHSRRRRIVIH